MQAPGQVQRGSGEGSEGSGEGLGGSGAEAGQVQQVSGEGSGEGLGGFGAEPGQVPRGSGEGFGEGMGGFGCRAVSEKVHRVPEEVPEKEVSEKVPGGFVQSQGFGAEAGQVQQGF